MINTFKNKNKILIIEPPFYNLFGYKRYHYPITPVLLATRLKDAGHKVMVYDMDRPLKDCKEYERAECGRNYPRYKNELKNPRHFLWEELKNIIDKFNPDAVGLSISATAKAASAEITAKIIKEIPGKKIDIVIGGAHVNGIKKTFPDYDFGNLYTEAVTTIPELINIKPDKTLLFNYESYNPQNFYSIMTSSGCPNKCTFCCNSENERIVYRNIDSIKEELYEIKEKYGCEWPVYYVDDCFLSNGPRMKAITAINKETGLKFKAGSRIRNLNDEKINDFINNGGIKMFVGVESGSQKILDKINKNISVSEIISKTALLNKHNINWAAFFITGFPFETLEDISLTKEIMIKIKPSFISINRFVPYPGTKIFDEYYLNEKFDFSDLFQLNLKQSCVKLSDEMEFSIEELFAFADEYNRTGGA